MSAVGDAAPSAGGARDCICNRIVRITRGSVTSEGGPRRSSAVGRHTRVAAINGACAGAGFGWAAACDLRFAASSATFNSAFLNVASAGDMSGPWFLPRLIGAAKARELYFLPDKFFASDALSLGLVSRVFEDAALGDEVSKLATRLAAASPHALRTMKQNFIDAESMDVETYSSIETERHSSVMAHPDAKEAFKAFVEKRPPKFG